MNRRIIQALGDDERFVAAEGRDVALLPVQIAGVMGVDLQLLRDFGCYIIELWPNRCEPRQSHIGQRKQFNGIPPHTVLPDRNTKATGLTRTKVKTGSEAARAI